jgi:hypothetical protein
MVDSFIDNPATDRDGLGRLVRGRMETCGQTGVRGQETGAQQASVIKTAGYCAHIPLISILSPKRRGRGDRLRW